MRFGGFISGSGDGVAAGPVLGGGQDRDGPLRAEGKLLLGHAQQAGELRPGTAGESFEGQQIRGSRLAGQAVPGVGASASGRAEVRVDLAGDVTL
jgi:hypothetical protein